MAQRLIVGINIFTACMQVVLLVLLIRIRRDLQVVQVYFSLVASSGAAHTDPSEHA